MSHYQYTLSFLLADDCPPAVLDFFQQLAMGATPPELPDSDERTLETPAIDVIALLAGGTQLRDSDTSHVTVIGTASPEQFYMPFIALCEWLARWSAAQGPVGYYHRAGLDHPTLLYFAAGEAYMLQATGKPVALSSGEAMPDAPSTREGS